MTAEEECDIERRLKSLTIRPAPLVLKEKVLTAAAKRKEETAWTTPRLKWTIAACTAVLAVVLIADAGLGRSERHRLQVILDGSRRVQSQANDESHVLAELLGEPVDRKLLARNDQAVARELKDEQVRRKELLRELLQEDFNGSERPENNH